MGATSVAMLATSRLKAVHPSVENLQATLRACADLDQQAARLQQLAGSFRI
ncbi:MULTISPECIES: hypothetical protein [unclassified Pseudomonas]|uniref:hypothetical protein n=1 Tax=Pseudomonas sp. BN606 TaxID=2567894 RepID=UPI00129E3E19|nr:MULTISPECIES: hypothetical protein [unclassified Pseudomonas]